MVNEITSFRGEDEFLSNFYGSNISVFGLEFRNAEAAFQSQKAPYYAHRFEEMDPSKAKSLGRKVPIRSNWEQVKNDVMREVLIAKFGQNKVLRDKLLETGNAELVEGNTWHDNYWGSCTCQRCRNNGMNHLGRLLTEVRDHYHLLG